MTGTSMKAFEAAASRSTGARAAVLVTDESCNLAIQPGEYAIFTPLKKDAEPSTLDGALLVVERERNGLTERSIRRASLRPDGRLKLVSNSSNTRFAETITSPSSRHGETIRLIGRVVGKYAEID
jgi:hypothetical protein